MKRTRLLCCTGLLVLFSLPARAGTMTETRPLAFGRLSITGLTVQSMILAPDGSETHDPGITLLYPRGHNGVFELTSYSVGLNLSASIADTTLDRYAGGSPAFDITDFTFDPPDGLQVTDGSGNLTLRIGATLSTRAATVYPAGAYRGTYTLMLNF